MYTILIVDDEALAREDISYKVGASGFPFSWIMEASSAEDALEIIRASRPNILLTDIKMGRKSGLDLLEEAREICPDMVTVIICGYPDFSYAQRALNLGVTNYLLKPVKKEELSEVLAKATQAVRRVRDRQTAVSHSYNLEKTVKQHRLQEAVNAFTASGGLDGESPLVSYFQEEEPRWYQMAMVYINLEDLQKWKQSRAENLLLYGIQNIAKELFGGKALIANSMENENILFILHTSPHPQNKMAEAQLYAATLRLKKHIQQVYHISVSISLSALYETLRPNIYTEASIALDMRFSYPKDAPAVLQYTTCAQLAPQMQDDKVSLLKRLLSGGEIRKAEHLAQEMILTYQATPAPGIRNLYRGIINGISVACFRKDISILPVLGSENLNGGILNSFHAIGDIARSISQIIETALGDTGSGKSGSEILLRVKQYIDFSFADSDLSTNNLSKEFCISLWYLSASYKQAHGITISKYIIQKRLEYAQKLLRETDFSVGEVAELSGFNNLSYFMRLFKSQYQITPSQYRQNEAPPDETAS